MHDPANQPEESIFTVRRGVVLWILAVFGWLVIIAGIVLWWGLPRWEPDLVAEESPWFGPAFEAVLHGADRWKFIKRLPDWGERVVPDMCTIAASNADIKRRLLALEVLESLNDPSAMPTLLALLKDPEEEIVQAALSGLEPLKDPAMVQPVLDLLLRSSPAIAKSAAILLATRPQPVPFEVISTTLLSASRGDLQALGCIVLRGGNDPRVIPALVERLGRFRDGMLDIAGYSLGQLTLPGATEAIATALADPDPRRRYGAVIAVRFAHGKVDRAALLQPLLQLTMDPVAEIQRHVIRALSNFPDEAALATLRSTLAAGGELAKDAIDSLSRNRSPAALPIMLAFIDHPEDVVRTKLRWSLPYTTVRDGTDHRPILTLLQHQDPDVVERAKLLARQLKLTPDERRELDAVK